MKNLVLAILCVILIPVESYAQSQKSDRPILSGVFERDYKQEGEKIIETWSFVDSYWVVSGFSKTAFKYTYGGPFYVENGRLKARIAFSQGASENFAFGKNLDLELSEDKNHLSIEGVSGKLKHIDGALNTNLSQTWVITGRKQGDKMTTRSLGARRTLKVLSDSRFQWIAFNQETGVFSGTGGGRYDLNDGKYTEHIEFFSRDNSRVGQSLSFSYAVKDGDWEHSGKSSKGKAIFEIWSPLSKVEKQQKKKALSGHFAAPLVGTWSGEMILNNQGVNRDTVRVELSIIPDLNAMTYGWKMTYFGMEKPLVKDYKLTLKDRSRGHYILDENNGILLSSYEVEGKLYGFYTYGETIFSTGYELQGEHLIFEVYGGKRLEEQVHDQVSDYTVDFVQRVVLNKK